MVRTAGKIAVQTLGAALAAGGAYVLYLSGRELYAAVRASQLAPVTIAPTLLMFACGAVPLPIAYRLLSSYDEQAIDDFCTLLAIIAALLFSAPINTIWDGCSWPGVQ